MTKHDAASAEALLRGLERAHAAAGRVCFGATGANGVRRGAVRTEPGGTGVVILRERGRFRFDDGREIPYTDAVRFARLGTGIEVSHLRRGAGRPVGLVRLVPRGSGALVSVDSHRCGADEYALVARIRGAAVTLEWTVRGPTKDGSIRVTYAPPGAGAARASDSCSELEMSVPTIS